MRIEQHHEDRRDDQILFDLWFQSRSVELHSRISDKLDLIADIRAVLKNASETISQLISNDTKRIK